VNVYIVTAGDYSDYHIEAVYLDKKTADRIAEIAMGDVEEWPIDVPPEYPVGLLPWTVVMNRNGDTKLAHRTTPSDDEWAPYSSVENSGFVSYQMWAADEKHAVKIANERRVQLIASGEWTDDWNAWYKRNHG
jgi:hypothetical protein